MERELRNKYAKKEEYKKNVVITKKGSSLQTSILYKCYERKKKEETYKKGTSK